MIRNNDYLVTAILALLIICLGYSLRMPSGRFSRQTVVSPGQEIKVVGVFPDGDSRSLVLVGERGPISFSAPAPAWSVGQSLRFEGVGPVSGPYAFRMLPGNGGENHRILVALRP
jgi:hypothetical protein